MLRLSLLATLAFSLCQTTAQAQMSHHQHASEAACEEVELRCASKVTPALASGRPVAGLDGGRQDLGGELEGFWAQPFDAGSGHARKTQPRLGSGRASPDRRRENRRHRASILDLQGQAFNGQVLATRSIDGGRSFAELQPITANSESQRFAARSASMRTDRYSRPGSTSATACPRSRRAGSTKAQGCSSRRRRTSGCTVYAEARLASDNTCECCRLGLAFRRRPSRRRVQKPLRGRCAGSRRHDIHRSSDAGRGSPRQHRRLADFGVPASRPQSFDLARRRVPRGLVHQRQGPQGAVLCPLG